MTEDVKLEVIKKTQDLLGKYFKKPPLTEKLLKKPPFRFLHDVVSSVIRETGFLDGLFSENELNSDNIKDKDAKLAYLTKLIDVVKLITGSNLTVRASKIIAGHEPTKTNELLQAIGKALDKKVSSAEAIEHYKSNNGRSRVVGKPRSSVKEDSKKPITSRQSSQSRKSTDKEKPQINNDQKRRSASTSKAVTKESRTRSDVGRERHRDREKENKTKDLESQKDERIVDDAPPAEPVEEKRTPSMRQRERRSSSVQRKEDSLSPKTSDSGKLKPALLDSTNSPTHKITKKKELQSDNTKSEGIRRMKSHEDKEKELPSTDLESRLSGGESRPKNSADGADISKKLSHSENNKSKKTTEKDSSSQGDANETKRRSSAIERANDADNPLSSKSETLNSLNNKIVEKENSFENPGSPPPKVIENSDDPMAKTKIRESSPPIRPRTSLRPPSARPMSARPAAPRIRSKAEFIFNEDITTPMGTVNVIVENFDTKEEEEDDDVDNMVVMETAGNSDSLNMEYGLPRTESQLSEEHGHLVAQILETQRELINTNSVDVMPKKVEIEWETGSRRDRESTIKEVDKLRGSIQTLTRATNPLGKLLDYLQEDIEMMQKELQDWRSQYNQLSEQLKQEQVLTQESIEPMKETLKDIEGNIKIQLDKICQVKAGVMKNDKKIHRLLNGHV